MNKKNVRNANYSIPSQDEGLTKKIVSNIEFTTP